MFPNTPPPWARQKRVAPPEKSSNSKRPRLGRFALSGPERAAARKRRQQLAKRAVARRVALYRSRIVDGERQTIYVTLGGEAENRDNSMNTNGLDAFHRRLTYGNEGGHVSRAPEVTAQHTF